MHARSRKVFVEIHSESKQSNCEERHHRKHPQQRIAYHGSDLSCISTIKGNSSVCSRFGAISFACFGTTAPSLTPRFQCWWKLHQCFSMLSYAAPNPCNSAICFKHLNADWIRGLCSSAESEPLSVLSLSLPSNST